MMCNKSVSLGFYVASAVLQAVGDRGLHVTRVPYLVSNFGPDARAERHSELS